MVPTLHMQSTIECHDEGALLPLNVAANDQRSCVRSFRRPPSYSTKEKWPKQLHSWAGIGQKRDL